MSQTAAAIAPTTPDFAAIKAKQQATWGAGDYGRIGVTLQITGESLCEAMDLHAGQSVLDVAAGNGNASLAAARRFCKVVSTDYVPALLDQSRARARAESLAIEYQQADAESLPFTRAPSMRHMKYPRKTITRTSAIIITKAGIPRANQILKRR
jgi:2-polyprenyl-3-methyl-5-hydroxy-6-metoxy-1,4-benzoquinol methylase